MRIRTALLILVTTVLNAGAPAQAHAAGDDLVVRRLAQGQFRDLAAELGLGMSAFQAQPAESLGLFLAVPHFDIGGEVTAVNINQDRPYRRLATRDGSAPSFLPLP